VIAQRGVHQVYNREGVDNETCTASRLDEVRHDYIENSLPSIAAAFRAGADVVEVDVRATADDHFVLFHDYELECRTDGQGRVHRTTLSELKRLDIGHGYTADGGRTYPLRGKGRGLMPTLEEALRAHPDRRFLIQFKDNHPRAAEAMVRYLEERQLADWDRLTFFGGPAAVGRLDQLRPAADSWSDKAAVRCTRDYLLTGWFGRVPRSCKGGTFFLPINLRVLVWGWPHRFLERMRRNDTRVIALGQVEGSGGTDFSRVDTIQQLNRLPPSYAGQIWTDRIELIGPAAERRFGAVGPVRGPAPTQRPRSPS
jgi:glycerophosphoryl diester phosphodiesterase